MNILDNLKKIQTNGNHNEILNINLINICEIYFNNVKEKPEIFTNANNSIQFEYKYDKNFLQFNIFEDKIEVFIQNKRQNHYTIYHNDNTSNLMNSILENFLNEI